MCAWERQRLQPRGCLNWNQLIKICRGVSLSLPAPQTSSEWIYQIQWRQQLTVARCCVMMWDFCCLWHVIIPCDECYNIFFWWTWLQNGTKTGAENFEWVPPIITHCLNHCISTRAKVFVFSRWWCLNVTIPVISSLQHNYFFPPSCLFVFLNKGSGIYSTSEAGHTCQWLLEAD